MRAAAYRLYVSMQVMCCVIALSGCGRNSPSTKTGTTDSPTETQSPGSAVSFPGVWVPEGQKDSDEAHIRIVIDSDLHSRIIMTADVSKMFREGFYKGAGSDKVAAELLRALHENKFTFHARYTLELKIIDNSTLDIKWTDHYIEFTIPESFITIYAKHTNNNKAKELEAEAESVSKEASLKLYKQLSSTMTRVKYKYSNNILLVWSQDYGAEDKPLKLQKAK